MSAPAVMEREFHLTVLGRTLEHLGVQMYKRRDTVIAELVANCWDAGATEVHVMTPTDAEYDQATSEIRIEDNGVGMTPDQVEEDYLVVGRNRRASDGDQTAGRPVMGRKGIGKLAGFGLATEMTVTTWKGESGTTTLKLDAVELKREPGDAETVGLIGQIGRDLLEVRVRSVAPGRRLVRDSFLHGETAGNPEQQTEQPAGEKCPARDECRDSERRPVSPRIHEDCAKPTDWDSDDVRKPSRFVLRDRIVATGTGRNTSDVHTVWKRASHPAGSNRSGADRTPICR